MAYSSEKTPEVATYLDNYGTKDLGTTQAGMLVGRVL
jgi:hypothetical protein